MFVLYTASETTDTSFQKTTFIQAVDLKLIYPQKTTAIFLTHTKLSLYIRIYEETITANKNRVLTAYQLRLKPVSKIVQRLYSTLIICGAR